MCLRAEKREDRAGDEAGEAMAERGVSTGGAHRHWQSLEVQYATGDLIVPPVPQFH